MGKCDRLGREERSESVASKHYSEILRQKDEGSTYASCDKDSDKTVTPEGNMH